VGRRGGKEGKGEKGQEAETHGKEISNFKFQISDFRNETDEGK
jgi:hypothetical protein